MTQGLLGHDREQLTIIAGGGDDAISGSAFKGYEFFIYGGDGNDTLVAGHGNDLLSGGDGDDQLAAKRGADVLDGGLGDDLMRGELGNDSFSGGEGNDFFEDMLGDNVVFDFEDRRDLIVVAELESIESIKQDGKDTLITFTGPGADGSMRLIGVAASSIDKEDFAFSLFGSDQTDKLFGQARWDVILAGAGDDFIDGDRGSDCLYGDAGNDMVKGGAGNDTAFGGEGDDQLFGDIGRDILSGGRGADALKGGDGDDRLYGGVGADSLDGGEGVDLADYSQAAAAVAIDLSGRGLPFGRGPKGPPAICTSVENAIGGRGNDIIVGSDVANDIDGGRGADTILGGGGADTLKGGAGADTFLYTDISHSTLGAADLIVDLASEDYLDLSAIDADITQSGDQAFHLGVTPGRAGDLTIDYDSTLDRSVIHLYIDGDASPDGAILFNGEVIDLDHLVL